MRVRDPETARRPDLRLVPAALAGWAVVLAGLHLGSTAAAGLGATGLFAAGVGWRMRHLRCAAGLVTTGGVVAALALVIGAQAWQLEQHPVAAGAARGAAATLVVEIRGAPVPIAAQGYGERADPDRVLIDAELIRAEIGADRWRTAGRVVLYAPARGWSALLPGQRVRAAGVLTPSAAADLTVAALRVREPPEVRSGPGAVQGTVERLRAGLRQASVDALEPAPAGLLPGLVVGDTSRMLPEVRQDFRAAGLTHLNAVSGTNVAIVCGAMLGLARLAGAGSRAAAVLAGLVLVGYVVLCRAEPSVLRAGVMGGVTLLALVLGRGRSAVPALAASVIGLLIVVPELGGAAGFALSVLATGGLVLLAPHWSAALRRARVPGGLAEGLAIPAAAFAVTAPVIAGLSGYVSLVSIGANLLAAPAVAPATVLGVLAAVIAPVYPPAAHALVQLAGPAVGWLVGVSRYAAAVPSGILSWPDGLRGGLLLAMLLVLALLLLRAPRLRVLAAVAVLGALLVLVPTRYATPGWPPAGWTTVACDVGQGDAIVLATGAPGQAVLVDTGPAPALVDACLDRLGIRTLALVVLTHLHADHVQGLPGALHGRSVAAVAVGPGADGGGALRAVRAATAAAGAPLLRLRAGRRVTWPGLVLDVLAPLDVRSSAGGAGESGSNDESVVARATTPAGRVLLTGDIELAAQARLLASGVDLRAAVLKAPHHGSPDTDTDFLRAVDPRVALVSVGADNLYGHPSPEVVATLTGSGARVLRTDRRGDIAVVATSDGLATAARRVPHRVS